MTAIPATVLVSDCCHKIIMIDDDGEQYRCTWCMKPCKSDGTLGEWYERQQKIESSPPS